MDHDTLDVEWVSTDRLFCNPANPRHNEDAVAPVAASLRRFGWRQPVVAKPSGEVIAGNTRLKAALSLGMDHVPVVRFKGSDIEATAYAIADNRTGEFATWDDSSLAQLLEELRAEDALDGVGYTSEEIDALLDELAAQVEPQDLDDPGPGEPPESPVTRTGDLWALGDHRLLCGDSTRPDALQRLMGGERAVLLATDPPYLVDYQGGNHPQSWHNRPETRDKHWDDYREGDGLEFFIAWLRCALEHLIDHAPVYQWHATRRQSLVERAWEQCGLLVHQTIVWVKARPVLTRCHYMWRSEPAFYGWRKGNMPPKDRRPDSNAQNVWEIDQQGETDGIHPTQKPRELFRRPIRFHTKPGEVVLEPFSGSGTQLIAAEELSRRCFAMEISPAFVDVAIERWQKATGKEATLDGTEQSFAEIAAKRGAED